MGVVMLTSTWCGVSFYPVRVNLDKHDNVLSYDLTSHIGERRSQVQYGQLHLLDFAIKSQCGEPGRTERCASGHERCASWIPV